MSKVAKEKTSSALIKALSNVNRQHKDGSKEKIQDADYQSEYIQDKTVVLLPIDELFAAPSQWNVFDPWTTEEMEENKFSI